MRQTAGISGLQPEKNTGFWPKLFVCGMHETKKLEEGGLLGAALGSAHAKAPVLGAHVHQPLEVAGPRQAGGGNGEGGGDQIKQEKKKEVGLRTGGVCGREIKSMLKLFREENSEMRENAEICGKMRWKCGPYNPSLPGFRLRHGRERASHTVWWVGPREGIVGMSIDWVGIGPNVLIGVGVIVNRSANAGFARRRFQTAER